VFHVRALYYTTTLVTNKCTKSFIINCNTLLHVSTLWSRLASRDRSEFTPPKTTLYTVSSTFSLNYKVQPSVTITKSSPWRWPSRVETCRSMFQLLIKLFVHLLVTSVFVYVNFFQAMGFVECKLTKWQSCENCIWLCVWSDTWCMAEASYAEL
jgi:hypothetical protein